MSEVFYKKIIYLFFLMFSLSSYSDELVNKFNLKLNDKSVEVHVYKNSSNQFYFEKESNNLFDVFEKRPQAYSLKNNRSKYFPYEKNAIDYRFVILNTSDHYLYPLLEKEYPLDNENNDQLNSMIIETYKQDISSYWFIFKYNYDPDKKQVLLSDLLYIESDMGEECDNVRYYQVSALIPEYIKSLVQYDSKKYTDYIIDKLYKMNDSLALNMLKVKEYKCSND